MNNIKFEKQGENVCNLNYLKEMMDGKKDLVKGIMDAFLEQVPEELICINNAVEKTDYAVIKKYAHTMQSTVSIMGIAVIKPILHEMEDLSAAAIDIEKIIELNQQLNLICEHAIREIEKDVLNYV